MTTADDDQIQRSDVEAWLRQGEEQKDPAAIAAERSVAAVPSEESNAREDDQREIVAGADTADSTAANADQEGSNTPGAMWPMPRATFQPSQHVSLLVSAFGLLLLLSATAIRFFHVGPLESIMLASEAIHPASTKQDADSVAEEMYFRGVYLCEQRSPAALLSAKELFQQAIARDPRNAASYAGLAKTYLLLREYATMPEKEAYDQAKEAADHAVRLDPNQAEAHAALGFIDFFWLWKAADAEQEFELAMQLDGRSALAHQWYGSMLMHQSRYAEALLQLDQAQRLDPTSAAILASKALALGFGGHKDEGIRLLEAMDGAGQETAMMHRNLAYLSLVMPQDVGRFLQEYQRFAEMRRDKETAEQLQVAAAVFAANGEKAMWETMLRNEQARHPEAAHPSYRMAQADAQLGHEDMALRELTQLAEDHDARMMGMILEPAFLALHKNAAFVHIAEQIGLVYPAVATR